MFEIFRGVAASELPAKTEFIPGKDAYLFDVSEVQKEDATFYLFSVVAAPRGTPEHAVLREVKFQRLDVLTVVVDGRIYDADTEARSNMASKLAVSTDTDIFPWKLHDNTWEDISGATLKEVLRSAVDAAGILRS